MTTRLVATLKIETDLEITPAMIKAGAVEVAKYRHGSGLSLEPEEIAVKVFRAMLDAAAAFK